MANMAIKMPGGQGCWIGGAGLGRWRRNCAQIAWLCGADLCFLGAQVCDSISAFFCRMMTDTSRQVMSGLSSNFLNSLIRLKSRGKTSRRGKS